MTSATDVAQRHIAELAASGLSERSRDAVSIALTRALTGCLSSLALISLNASEGESAAARAMFRRFMTETFEGMEAFVAASKDLES